MASSQTHIGVLLKRCSVGHLSSASHLEHIKVKNQPTLQQRKKRASNMGQVKGLSSQSTTSSFHHPTSRDLRSHRKGYHQDRLHVGLKPIPLDALSITLRDSPLVN
jgi:hypothetical protein